MGNQDLTTESKWKALAARKRKVLDDSIPQEWLIPKCPITDFPNVIDVPHKCGLLTPRELEITETKDVDCILQKLRNREWTSVETTRAFYKRAVIAHQLVSQLNNLLLVDSQYP